MKREQLPKPPSLLTAQTVRSDVVVIGAGLAGLCAALAAAREGAQTVLVNDRPVLGGNASTEIRVPPSGAGENNPWAMETGIILELLLEERAGSFERPGEGMLNARWDTVLYDTVRRQKNLTLFLNTSVLEVEKAGPVPTRFIDGGDSQRPKGWNGAGANRIASVTGVNRRNEKRIRFEAKMFIEATGDGLIGAQAGVPFRIGQESRSEYGESLAPEKPWDWTLGCSLYFHARDVGRPVEFQPPPWAARYETEESLGERHHAAIDGGYWWIEIGHPFDTIKQDDEIRDELLRHLYGVWDHIKNHCKDRAKARNFALDWVSMVPGRRESRRFIGAHVLTETEIRARTLFSDRIAYGGWLIDDHTKGGILAVGKKPSFDDVTQGRCYVAPYSVPLSSLYAPQIENLLFAGRVMSASRLAFNSLRVQRTLAIIGQAAGTASAHAVRQGRAPSRFADADIRQVQQSLLRQDCYIPFVRNEDPDDLARTAQITASSQATILGEPDGPGIELKQPVAQILPVSGDRLDTVQLYLENRNSQPQQVRLSLLPARDIWDLAGLDGKRGQAPFAADGPTGASHKRCLTPFAVTQLGPGAKDWASFNMNARLEPRRIFWLRVEGAPGVFWHMNRWAYPGFCVAKLSEENWQFAHVRGWRNLAVRVSPASHPFGPENVNQGAARPETWPNLWISDPAQPLPQWLELRWPKPQRFSRVQLAFDTDLSRTYWGMAAAFRAPECAKDFSLAVPGKEPCEGSKPSQGFVTVKGNYQRLRVVEFPPLSADRLRLIVESTHAAPSARIYDLRVYGP